MKREDLLVAIYQTSSKKELLAQFDSKLSGVKGSATQRYIHLLEQVLFYSHAIIFDHGVQTAHNYRQNFMSTAKKNKLLKLSNEDVEKAFSFLNRTEKKALTKEVSTVTETPQKSTLEGDDKCIAKDEIRDLKAQLDDETYELSRGQKKEDKEAFIKIAIVALSTGARLNDIMENLTISTKKAKIFFNDGLTVQEGVILGLEPKTVQSYIKSIRKHYSDRIGKVDISTGIRKAVKKLNIPNCGNLNHLNALYKECLTSSTQK